MKVIYFLTLLFMMSVAQEEEVQCENKENDPKCLCKDSGGYPDNLESVCCRADCGACDDHTYCGHNGGNPWCCSTTILHNHGECTDNDAIAPCVRIDIRKEQGDFVFVEGGAYSAGVIGNDDGNPIYSNVGWHSTGFVVQLEGVVNYNPSNFIGDTPDGQQPNALVGSLAMVDEDGKDFGFNFCPIVDQTFSVTNTYGLSVSITVAADCELRVDSWALHKVYFNVPTKQFYRLENFYPPPVVADSAYGMRCTEHPCEEVIRDNLGVYEETGDQNQIDEMHHFDLGGITYIGQYIKNVEMIKEDPDENGSSVHFLPEINYNLIYGLLILGLILWECIKCYVYQKGNSPYGKVPVHYLDDSSQSTEIDVQ